MLVSSQNAAKGGHGFERSMAVLLGAILRGEAAKTRVNARANE